MPFDGARAWWWMALAVATAATLGSLSLSGIGPLGWRGLGYFPCELCWYQRVLMYPIPLVVGVALARRARGFAWIVLPLAVAGFLVATYHVLIQANPALEAGQCYVGSCVGGDLLFGGLVSVPQLSWAAFLLVAALALMADRAEAAAAG